LTWRDVDFEQSEVRVVRKDASEKRAAWTPKDKEMRVIPLPTLAVNVLVELQLAAADGHPAQAPLKPRRERPPLAVAVCAAEPRDVID